MNRSFGVGGGGEDIAGSLKTQVYVYVFSPHSGNLSRCSKKAFQHCCHCLTKVGVESYRKCDKIRGKCANTRLTPFEFLATFRQANIV